MSISFSRIIKKPFPLAAFLGCLFLSLVSRAQEIAFTFDDLPAHSNLPPGETRQQVAIKIVEAIKAAHLPPVYGFMNGIRVEEQPDTIQVLNAWRDAGFPLGNHSWSHMNLNQHTLEEFETDVLKNEPLLRKEMGDADWHWFRFPNLAEGDTPEKRAGVRSFLAQHGYKIAGVTMSFADYNWNAPYARCSTKGDTAAIAQLESSYLAAADQSISFYREMSKTLYGRDIPYVLLMHLGAFDARMLPRLLELYRSHGFKFATIDDAQRDEFYRSDMNPALAAGPQNLEAAMAARRLPLPPLPAPTISLDMICR
jgi:peptidoglycan-N-acetylglucosamine deacetylase